LLRHKNHNWQKKTTKKNQNFDTLNTQPIQNFFTPHYTEKMGGLPHHQTLTPNLLGRHLADQQVSKKCHAVFPQPPLDSKPLDRLIPPPPCKKKRKMEQQTRELKRNTEQRVQGAVSSLEKGGRAKS
jgi:hypothetical protein